MNKVTLFTKPGCHLCEEVEEAIRHVIKGQFIDLELRNILDSLEDYERYKHDIPVVLLNGHEIARHRMSENDFRRALAAR